MTENQVKITYSDNNPNYLSPKLQGGNNIVLTDNGNFIRIDAITSPGDHAVLVDGNDTSPGFLGSKLEAGSGVSLVNTGSTIQINANTQSGDHKVIVDSNDTSPGYLLSKLTAGSNVTITNNGTDLEISSTDTGFANPMTAKGDLILGGTGGTPSRLATGTSGQVLTSTGSDTAWADLPGYVKVAAADSSPDYLSNKLVQGTGITLTTGANSITVAFDNPMTTAGDIIVGGASGSLSRLAKGYQGQVLKVGSNGLEWGTDIGFANPMEELGDLIVGTYDGVASRLPIGTVNQFLFSNGTTAEWATLPLNIDWFVNPGLANGEFNQAIDRTFYVRMYPSLQMRAINHVAILLSGAVAADVLRAAVYDNSRTMIAYGESTSSSSTFRRITLTQLQPWTPGTNDLYYLGVSIHASSNSSTKIKTASVTSPSYCWYEDVALTSGRAMPATSSLTVSSSKVPIIGLRGR